MILKLKGIVRLDVDKIVRLQHKDRVDSFELYSQHYGGYFASVFEDECELVNKEDFKIDDDPIILP